MIYPNYRNDRIQCGYTVNKDLECGDSLIQVVQLPKNFQLKNYLETQKKYLKKNQKQWW